MQFQINYPVVDSELQKIAQNRNRITEVTNEITKTYGSLELDSESQTAFTEFQANAQRLSDEATQTINELERIVNQTRMDVEGVDQATSRAVANQ